MSGRAKLAVLVAVIACLAIAATFLPIRAWTLELVARVRDAGAVGWALFFGSYVAATLLLIPASALTLGAGSAYGFGGALIVWPAAVLGAVAAFMLGRSVGRRQIEHRLEGHERLEAIDRAMGDRGFSIAVLLRLSPVFPFGLLNYALSLTRVGPGAYAAATAVGIIPGTFLYIYIGTSITDLAAMSDAGGGSTARQLIFWLGLVATVVATVVITRVARRRLAMSHSVTTLPTASNESEP